MRRFPPGRKPQPALPDRQRTELEHLAAAAGLEPGHLRAMLRAELERRAVDVPALLVDRARTAATAGGAR